MNTMVIYDSVFGNTEQVAREIGNSLDSPENVEILRVGSVKPDQLTGLKLLIVGSPTRGFRPTESITKFLKRIPVDGLEGTKVAAFDTRISTDDIKSSILGFLVKIGGYAAKPIAGRLQKKGGDLVMPPEGFFVNGTEGPMKQGELERAAEWAKQIDRLQMQQNSSL